MRKKFKLYNIGNKLKDNISSLYPSIHAVLSYSADENFSFTKWSNVGERKKSATLRLKVTNKVLSNQ